MKGEGMANIAYVVHPVTPEQKKELRAKGLQIMDARFAPEGAEIIGAPAPAPKADPEVLRLRDVAASYGIEVDGRWGVERLNDEIQLAQSAQATEDTPNAEEMPQEA